ncbi:MAG TPA: hypothetical protein PKJ08_00045 [Candidatus Cloacimonadota bacterium]|nr:hypothetical protein [Candidatus Cloacimonadota bacterium]
MSEENQPIGNQGIGNPLNPQSQDGVGTSNKAEFVTRVELENLRKEFDEKARRLAQSYSMQAEGRIDKKIKRELAEYEKGIETLKSIGKEISPEEIEKGRQNIITKAYLQQDQPQNQNQPVTQPAGNDQRTDTQPGRATPETILLNNMANRILKMHGVEDLAKEDPEAAMVRFDDYDTFLDTFEQAVAAKAKRIGTRPEARISTMAGSGSSTPALKQQYEKELKALPRGPNSAIARQQLRMKYRKLGYDPES